VYLVHCSQDGQLSFHISDDVARSQFQQVSGLPIVCHTVADFLHHSSDRRIPFLLYYVALVCRTPRLELWLQFHEQHHVRRALRDLTRAVPDKGSWDGERTRSSRKSYLWDHCADYRSLRELGDIGAYLCFCLSVHRVGFHCITVTVRAAWEGVIVDTQQNAAARLVP
jgi:hypothetical protein